MFLSRNPRICALAFLAAINLPAAAAPVMEIIGNFTTVTPGSTTPDLLTGTNFGDVQLGASRTSGFLLDNTHGSPGSHLILSSIVFSGANASDFTLSTVPATFDLAFDVTTGFSVIFTPGAAGPRTATLTFNSNDPVNPHYVIVLGGNGVEQAPALPDLSLRFAEELFSEGNAATQITKKKVLIEATNSGDVIAGKATVLVFTQPDFPFQPGTARLIKKKRIKNLGAKTSRQFTMTLKIPSNESITYFLISPDVATNERDMRDNLTVVSLDTL